MDSNGNKVQTLRQQFEGLRKSETPNVLQKSKKLPSQLAKSNGINCNGNGKNTAIDSKSKAIVSPAGELNYKMLNTSFNVNNTRADGGMQSPVPALLKSGNRSGFIGASSVGASTSADTKSSLSAGSEQNGGGQDTAESGSATSSDVTIELNCKLDPLSSPSLRNIRRKRNGIYVSDAHAVAVAATLGVGESFVLNGNGRQDEERPPGSGHSSGGSDNDNSLDDEYNGVPRPTSAGDFDDTDESSGNSQSNSNRSSLHGSVNVKRSNAFRQRDIDSPEPRFVGRGSKIVLDRVKSLDLPRNATMSATGAGDKRGRADDSKRTASTGLSLPMQQHERPKSLASATAKAVNVVTPYQVSDIYPCAPDATLLNSKPRRGSGKELMDMEAPEYAVPIPLSHRGEGNSNGNATPPEPPKYPPPPPAYQSTRQIPPPTARAALTSFQQLPFKARPNTKENRLTNQSGRGPPPEKPPRTFLYDILSDQNHRLRTQKNSLTLLPQRSPARAFVSDPSTPERKSATMKMSTTSADTFYKREYSGSSEKSLVKPKVAISTAKIRQTTPNSGARVAQDGKAVLQQQQQQSSSTPSTNHGHQMLVRSKTESQIILNGGKGRAATLLHAESPLSHLASGAATQTHRSLGRGCNSQLQLSYASQLYLNQQHSSSPNQQNYGGSRQQRQRQEELYNLMSNTNLLQQRHAHGRSGTATAITPLRSESNLVYSAKKEAPLDSSFHLHRHQPNNANANNSGQTHKLGLPPSPLQTGGREFRLTRQHSNSLLFMNNLIRLSSYNGGGSGGGFGARDRDGEYIGGSGLARNLLDNRSDERLCLGLVEKSKSEWALNRVGIDFGIGDGSAGVGSFTAAATAHSVNLASSRNFGARRNTIPTDPVSSSSPLVGGGGGEGSIPTTGHTSLDSSTSTHSSGKLLRSGIQQSIQNLVNQLFSPSASASASSSSPVIGTTTKEATSSTDSGIQLGSESLSSCDTPVGDSTTDTGDSDCENDAETSNNARQVVEARKGYIRRVSSIRVQEIPSIHRLFLQTSRRPNSGESLFECLLIVGLNRDPYTGVYHPYIRDKFPANAKVAAGVEQFCFPDSLEWPCHEGPTAQSYTLAITDHRGSRKYGCCYRILPEGASICIPITYVIISAHRAIGFYREVLRELAQRHGYAEYQKRYIMEDLFKKSFPAPMEDITVTDPFQDDMYLPFGQSQQQQQQSFNMAAMAEEGLPLSSNYHPHNFILPSPRTIVIRRKADRRLEEGDLVTLLTALDLSVLLKLFGSLLLERKVVLISRSLCTVSLCVEALESMLYPFTWQHTFVPILPLTMTDVLDAPAPFLIGCLRSLQTPWDKTLDEGIVIELDQNKVLSCVGDESNILPKRIYRKLRTALQFVVNMPDQKEHTKNVLTSECFIRMFVETLGHYSNHIVEHGQKDGVKVFDRESFVRASDTKATQNFLEWFSETSMFHEFIELRLKGNPPPGLFEQRILEQSELNASTNGMHAQTQTAGGTPLTFKNAKFFMKGSKPFGNWLKDAFVK